MALGKTFFVALAFGAVAAHAAQDGTTPPAAPPAGEFNMVSELEALASGIAEGAVDFSQFSPDKLGMNLNFRDMSDEELSRIASVFVSMGLVKEEELPSLKVALRSAPMAHAAEDLMNNFEEKMETMLQSKELQDFIQKQWGNVTPDVLKKLLNIEGDAKEGLQKIVNRLTNEEDM